VNPTYLYQAIEARQWKHVGDYLSTEEQAHVQAATWVIRKETNGKLRWRLLPLHAAIIFGAPLEVLELLLGEHPAAAQCKDDQGMLPLHLAFRNFQSWDILEELLTAYPQAISVKDRRARTPLQCACSAFRKPASVLELYTHVAVTTERVAVNKKNNNELHAQIGALQESHVQVLEGLKSDWQERSQLLEQELKGFEAQYNELQVLYNHSQQELARKTELQHELTTKLTLVTEALTTSENIGVQAESKKLQALLTSENTNGVLRAENSKLQTKNVKLRAIIQDLLNNQKHMQQRLHQFVLQQDLVVQQRQERFGALLETFKETTSTDGFVSEVQREWQESNQHAADLLSQLLLDGSGDATSNVESASTGGNEVRVLVVEQDGSNGGAVTSSGEEVKEQEPNDKVSTRLQEEPMVVTSPTPSVPAATQEESSVPPLLSDPPTF
jgi:hypothetical protein